MHASVRLDALGCFLGIRACLTASSLGCQMEKAGSKIRDQKFECLEKELESEYFNEIRYEYSLEPYL